MLELCRRLSKDYSLACVTNDIFTTEDTDFLVRNKALEDPERIVAIETGGCPHAAIREDISANLAALEQLQAKFNPELLLIESGGDNLAANYSRELADYIIYGTFRSFFISFFYVLGCCQRSGDEEEDSDFSVIPSFHYVISY